MEEMEKVILHATHRNVKGKQVNALRRSGQLPGVMYGHHIDSTAISMDLHDATRLLGTLTESSLVTIELDGNEHAALVREKQRDFIKGTLKHVDFQVVSLTEKIRTRVGIELVGLSPAVKDFNGVVVTSLDHLEVECLPQYLPERIVVDISKLVKIGDGIYVRDIRLPEQVEILDDLEEMLVIVTAQIAEEEEEVAPVEAVTEEPEVIEKGRKEEEEGEEEESKK
jgi:large subunit ribosomal protein L25